MEQVERQQPIIEWHVDGVMFSNLFLSKEQVEYKTSMKSYENAALVRKRRINFWRNNALTEIRFLYPDAEFLMNEFRDHFYAYSEQKVLSYKVNLPIIFCLHWIW